MIEQDFCNLTKEMDKEIINRIFSLSDSIKKVKECDNMLSLTTTYETIILKKRTHKVFNKIRYTESGMRVNYLINIQNFKTDERS